MVNCFGSIKLHAVHMHKLVGIQPQVAYAYAPHEIAS